MCDGFQSSLQPPAASVGESQLQQAEPGLRGGTWEGDKNIKMAAAAPSPAARMGGESPPQDGEVTEE